MRSRRKTYRPTRELASSVTGAGACQPPFSGGYARSAPVGLTVHCHRSWPDEGFLRTIRYALVRKLGLPVTCHASRHPQGASCVSQGRLPGLATPTEICELGGREVRCAEVLSAAPCSWWNDHCGGEITSKERRRDLAGLFAKLLFRSLQDSCSLRGKWRIEAYAPDKIDEERSGSLLEVRLVSWPPRFRLSIHSDDGGSVVGYGVFRPPSMNRRSNDDGLREHLEEHVSRRGATRVHWAWYADLDEPLRDFARHETMVEVEKIRRLEAPKDNAAFRQASDDLAVLAEALDRWYSKVSAAAPICRSNTDPTRRCQNPPAARLG